MKPACFSFSMSLSDLYDRSTFPDFFFRLYLVVFIPFGNANGSGFGYANGDNNDNADGSANHRLMLCVLFRARPSFFSGCVAQAPQPVPSEHDPCLKPHPQRQGGAPKGQLFFHFVLCDAGPMANTFCF